MGTKHRNLHIVCLYFVNYWFSPFDMEFSLCLLMDWTYIRTQYWNQAKIPGNKIPAGVVNSRSANDVRVCQIAGSHPKIIKMRLEWLFSTSQILDWSSPTVTHVARVGESFGNPQIYRNHEQSFLRGEISFYASPSMCPLRTMRLFILNEQGVQKICSKKRRDIVKMYSGSGILFYFFKYGAFS